MSRPYDWTGVRALLARDKAGRRGGAQYMTDVHAAILRRLDDWSKLEDGAPTDDQLIDVLWVLCENTPKVTGGAL